MGWCLKKISFFSRPCLSTFFIKKRRKHSTKDGLVSEMKPAHVTKLDDYTVMVARPGSLPKT